MTEPLTPPDCDLRDFSFMPLDVVRLRDSETAVVLNAEEFRAAVILWCAAWHQVPAASVPDDDRLLANLAGFGRDVTGWQSVKDGALRSFIKCDDGRLYHPVIAEKAVEAWGKKWERPDRREARSEHARKAAEARWGKQRTKHGQYSTDAQPMPEQSSGNALRGQGQGEGHEDNDGARASADRIAAWKTSPGYRIAKQIAKEVGEKAEYDFEAHGWGGAVQRVSLWLAHWTEEQIIASVRQQMQRKRADPPRSINFFEKGIATHVARERAAATDAVPKVVVPPRPTETVSVPNETTTQRHREPWQEAKDRGRAAFDKLRASVQRDREGSEGGGGPDDVASAAGGLGERRGSVVDEGGRTVLTLSAAGDDEGGSHDS